MSRVPPASLRYPVLATTRLPNFGALAPQPSVQSLNDRSPGAVLPSLKTSVAEPCWSPLEALPTNEIRVAVAGRFRVSRLPSAPMLSTWPAGTDGQVNARPSTVDIPPGV